MIRSGVAIIVLLLAAAIGYYYYGYGPEIYKRRAQQALDDFSQSMATKDRGKVKETLENLLVDNAKIRLEVSFFSLSQMQGSAPETEDFDKPTFLTFIDNTLYSLQDYGMSTHVQELKFDLDKKTAFVTFDSQAWGDSESSYGDTHINMRYVADTLCKGHAVFAGKHPTFDNADCKMQLHSLPKMGEKKKILQSPEALKQLLR